MWRRGGVLRRVGLVVVLVAAVPLAACSTVNFGGLSSFGSGQQQIAEVPQIGSYTADTALAEARNHFRDNDFGYSAALYKRVVELSPKDQEAYVGLAASYDRLGRFDLSDRVYASLYALSGGTAQYFNNVGYSYLLRGNVAAAMTNFRKAQRLDPNNLVVANNMQMVENVTAGTRT